VDWICTALPEHGLLVQSHGRARLPVWAGVRIDAAGSADFTLIHESGVTSSIAQNTRYA
jgi:hypothetical protein